MGSGASVGATLEKSSSFDGVVAGWLPGAVVVDPEGADVGGGVSEKNSFADFPFAFPAPSTSPLAADCDVPVGLVPLADACEEPLCDDEAALAGLVVAAAALLVADDDPEPVPFPALVLDPVPLPPAEPADPVPLPPAEPDPLPLPEPADPVPLPLPGPADPVPLPPAETLPVLLTGGFAFEGILGG